MPPACPERALPPLLRDPLHHAALPLDACPQPVLGERQEVRLHVLLRGGQHGLQVDDQRDCEPLRLRLRGFTPGGAVCAHAPDFCAQLRALLPLVETKPGSRALTRAAAWTSVLPWPAQHHHGHEDPEARAREDFRRGDQDQGSGQGKLRHRHEADPRKRQ